MGSRYLQHFLTELWAPPSRRRGRREHEPYTLIFLHPRGTGNSSQMPWSEKMSTMDMVSDVEELRLHLGVDQFPVILGHSNGGSIALGYAETYVDRVKKLILISPHVLGQPDLRLVDLAATQYDPAYGNAWERATQLKPVSNEQFTKEMHKIWPLFFFDPPTHVDGLVDSFGGEEFSAWTFLRQKAADRPWKKAQKMFLDLSLVRADTLIMFGLDDFFGREEVAVATKERIPNSILIRYRNCGHFPMVERETDVLRDIRRFIGGRSRRNGEKKT